MASILINPTSASMGASGGSGSIALTVETDSWHTSPREGDIWMAQRRKTDGTWGSWAVFRIVGEDGEDGNDGKGISSTAIAYATSSSGTSAPPSGWQSSVPSVSPGFYLWTRVTYTYTDGTSSVAYSVARQGSDGGAGSSSPTLLYQGYFNVNPWTGETETRTYHGDSSTVDVVYHNGMYYVAKSTAGTFSSASWDSSKWDTFGASFDSVATGLIFAQEAAIEKAYVRMLRTSDGTERRVVIQNNTLTMYDDNGRQKLLVTGEELGDLSDSFSSKSFSSGTMTGSGTDISGTNTLISSPNFQITSVDNTVELPSITVDVFKSATEDTINASASLLIDGVVVASSPTYNGVPESRHIYLVIPARTLALEKGPHTLSIQAQASSVNGTLGTISYPGSSTAGTVDISYNSEKVQIGANGFRAAFGASNYAEFISNSSNPTFTIRAGNYALRVSSSGIQATSSMNAATPTWRSL